LLLKSAENMEIMISMCF